MAAIQYYFSTASHARCQGARVSSLPKRKAILLIK